ncbi:hypothetical protein K402DRAFT_375440 [Aulographum hederae CBS 113979]|uniref:CENP-V/GFA domain-containing protein n=1 Tax=Aulographum hederae CBS 113979 TaxID=1176131 RepID=A0A6G1H2Y3_9PEZI|nr:hypothetical protein K402DRAFT_375440 [Aulographum hederae CBS 113979]
MSEQKHEPVLPAEDPDAPKYTYTGNCHCAANVFTADFTSGPNEGAQATCCNCSICSKNGDHFVYTKDANVTFLKGGIDNGLTKYEFGPKRIAHYFCPTCGTSMCARSVDPTFFPGMTALNVRAFKDIDMQAVALRQVNGKAHGDPYPH